MSGATEDKIYFMKTLLLVRHAKSSWDDLSMADIDRPLNKRGKNDAPEMAGRLRERKINIDRFVSSPAVRARKTAEIFMDVYDEKKKKLVLVPALYEAGITNFYDVISLMDDKDDTVALFSHNPGITDMANSLSVNRVDNMPTCSVFAVVAKIKAWKDFHSTDKEFQFFDYPKNQD